jgi:hypothetical protein
MSVESLLARGRSAYERLMLDTVAIDRKTQGAFNPTTGEYGTTWTVIYTGPADIKPERMPRDVDAGETATAVGRYDVKLPFATAALVKVEDRVAATASLDVHLIGRPLYVTAVGLGSRRTAWHITAVDQEQP